MNYSNNYSISCFHLTYLNNNFFINSTVFNSEQNFTVIQMSKTKTEGITKGNLTLSSIDKKSKEDKLYGESGDMTKNGLKGKIDPFTY